MDEVERMFHSLNGYVDILSIKKLYFNKGTAQGSEVFHVPLEPREILPIIAYTERLRPKGVPFSGRDFNKG